MYYKSLIVTSAAIALGMAGINRLEDRVEGQLYDILHMTPKIIAENCVSQTPECRKISGSLTPYKYHDGRTYYITNKHVIAPLRYNDELAKTRYTMHNFPDEHGELGLEMRLESIHNKMDLALLSVEGKHDTLEKFPLCEPYFDDTIHTFGFGHGTYKIHGKGMMSSDIVYELLPDSEYYNYSNDTIPGMSGGPVFLEHNYNLCLTAINSMTLDNSYGFGIPIQHAENLYQKTILAKDIMKLVEEAIEAEKQE